MIFFLYTVFCYSILRAECDTSIAHSPRNFILHKFLTPLNNKFLDQSKLTAFADDKVNVTLKQKFFLGLVENIMGKGENAGYQHFLLFPQGFFSSIVKSLDSVVKS